MGHEYSNPKWIPPFGEKLFIKNIEFPEVVLTIHSPNAVPIIYEMDGTEITKSQNHMLRFSKITVNSLKAPYNTNCHDYRLGSNDDLQSQNDCIFKCILISTKQKCGNCIPQWIITRRDLIQEEDRFCAVYKTCYQYFVSNAIVNECKTKCRPDCHQMDYKITLKTHELEIRDIFTVAIRYESSMQMTITHSPDMTFIVFLANASGIFGIWMGINVLSLFDYMHAFYNFLKSQIKPKSNRTKVWAKHRENINVS